MTKLPPMYKAWLASASAKTLLFTPSPSVDQPTLPVFFVSNTAIRAAPAPPASVNPPPTYKSSSIGAKANTKLFTPSPSADQPALPVWVVSNTAIRFAVAPAACVNCPPTYRSSPIAARAFTFPFTPFPSADQPALPVWVVSNTTLRFAPSPSVDQPLFPVWVVSKTAMRFAAVPPASVKAPPTYRSSPIAARADTGMFTPSPSGDQPALPVWLVSNTAMRFAGAPPAWVKAPPTYRSSPINAKADTVLLTPSPSGDQPALPVWLVSNTAMRFAGLPPAWANNPPTYRSSPLAARANTAPFTPSPSDENSPVPGSKRAIFETAAKPQARNCPPTNSSPATAASAETEPSQPGTPNSPSDHTPLPALDRTKRGASPLLPTISYPAGSIEPEKLSGSSILPFSSSSSPSDMS